MFFFLRVHKGKPKHFIIGIGRSLDGLESTITLILLGQGSVKFLNLKSAISGLRELIHRHCLPPLVRITFTRKAGVESQENDAFLISIPRAFKPADAAYISLVFLLVCEVLQEVN